MTSRLPTLVIACLVAAPAFAQTPAASGRCTGVLCDLYYSGRPAPAPAQPGQAAPLEPPDPTHLPCRDFLCAAFGGRTPDAPPPAADPVAAPAPERSVKAAKRKHKVVKTMAAAEVTKPDVTRPDAAK